MPKQKISEFNSNPALNTDIDSINIAEGCSPSGINDAIRELMSQLKDWQAGTSNDPMVIGSTGSLTLNQGTANGVAYLNGSKVVTSGSALTFNGTNFGVGVSPALARLHTSTNTATTADFTGSVRITNESYTAGTYAGVLFETADTLNSYVTSIRQGSYAGILAFGVNTGSSGTSLSEQMRLTSTGLGIGTSSPSAKLNVVGSSDMSGIFESTGTSNAASLIVRSGNGTTSGLYAYARFVNNDTNAQDWRIGTYGNNNLSIVNAKAGTTPVVLDSSGNLGLGVNPSAWGSSMRAIQIGTLGSFHQNDAGSFYGSRNSYNSSTGYKYLTTSTAQLFGPESNGGFAFYLAPSGTAGNAISWTQAMTLDASGNLLVGTTSSDGSRLRVYGSYQTLGDGAYEGLIGKASSLVSGGGSGDFAIRSAANLVFSTNGNTERARIDSSGNLLVGTTSFATPGFAVNPSGYFFIGNNAQSSGWAFATFQRSGTTIGTITQNGTTGVLYNLTSDYRLKNNPVTLTGSGAFIDSLQPKTWDWWDGSGKGVGFIAHEFMEVAKYSGNGEKDAVDAEGKPVYQSIQPSSSEVMANLVAEIQSLRKRLADAGL